MRRVAIKLPARGYCEWALGFRKRNGEGSPVTMRTCERVQGREMALSKILSSARSGPHSGAVGRNQNVCGRALAGLQAAGYVL